MKVKLFKAVSTIVLLTMLLVFTAGTALAVQPQVNTGTGVLDIVLTVQNLATNKDTNYYGVSSNWTLGGTAASHVISAKVELLDAAGNVLATNMSKSAGRVNNTEQGPGYSSAFIVKAGTYPPLAGSSTWNFGVWTASHSVAPKNARITLTDDALPVGGTYIGTTSDLSNTTAVPWVSLFPVFSYSVTGDHGTISGNATQTVAWSGTGATGTEVTAVAENGYHFTGWSDGVLTAARTDAVPADASITTVPPYSGVSVTASFVKTDIVLTPQNLATNKAADYYGVSSNWQVSGTDVVADVASVKVEIYSATNVLMATNTTKSAAKATQNQAAPTAGCPGNGTCGGYSSAFIVKAGTYPAGGVSSTWNFGSWQPTHATAPSYAKVTVTDIFGSTYVGDTSTLSNIENTPWVSLFPVFTYAVGTGEHGTISGNANQTVAWSGAGATGTAVTAVGNTGYYFKDWSDGLLTPARTDTVPSDASITAVPPYSGLSVTASFALPFTISGTIHHTGLLAGGTTIKFQTATTFYPGTINLLTGVYSIPGIPYNSDGSIIPSIGSGGYSFTPPSIDLLTITADLPGQDFTANGNRVISGKITGPLGARLPVGTVVNFGGGLTFTQGVGTTTDFAITNLPPKSYLMGLLNITYPGTQPFLNNRLYIAPAVMPLVPPTTASSINFASTVYGDDTVGNNMMYFWTPFTLTGTIKTPAGVNPVLKSFQISLVGTGDFAGQSLIGTYNSKTSTFAINAPFTKIDSTITPAAFTGDLLITGVGYQTFTPLGSFVMNANRPDNNVTAYGDRAIFGKLAGAVPPDGTLIDFGGGLTSTVQDGGYFYLPYLERKSYTLKPVATGFFFTANATSTTQTAQIVNLAAGDKDLSGLFFGKASPLLTSPANASVQNTGASVTFTWTAPTGAPVGTKYKVQYATNATFSTGLVTGAFVTTTTYTPATFVNNVVDKTYFWRVTAYTATGTVISVSAPWTFSR